VKPEVLRHKVFEPVLFIGKTKVKNLDIRLRVKGGGHVSQIYGEQRGSSSSAGSRSVDSRDGSSRSRSSVWTAHARSVCLGPCCMRC
jgi:small subunit ribosomal protein S16e